MIIKICGPGCAACDKTQKIVEAAVAAKGVGAAIVKVTEFQDMAMLGVFSTPAVVVNDVVRCVGRVPQQSEVEDWLG
jgi:small redox-active disulfide protein 2